MASDYGLNFGFRRSDESYRISEGRFRTPATGPQLLQGTVVEIDPANAGYLRAAAADTAPRPGICGLLVQEEVWDRSFYESHHVDSFDLGVTLLNRLSVVTNGAGVKVWFKNTEAQSRLDGRAVPAVTMFDDPGDLALGDQMGWDGTQFARVDGAGVNEAYLELTDVSDNYIEGVLLV